MILNSRKHDPKLMENMSRSSVNRMGLKMTVCPKAVKHTSKCNSTEEHSFPQIPNYFVECFEDSWPKTLLFFIFLSFFAIIVGHLLTTEKSIFVKGEFMNPKWSQCHWSCVCVCMKRMRALSSD